MYIIQSYNVSVNICIKFRGFFIRNKIIDYSILSIKYFFL